jgi:hypothetical protein
MCRLYGGSGSRGGRRPPRHGQGGFSSQPGAHKCPEPEPGHTSARSPQAKRTESSEAGRSSRSCTALAEQESAEGAVSPPEIEPRQSCPSGSGWAWETLPGLELVGSTRLQAPGTRLQVAVLKGFVSELRYLLGLAVHFDFLSGPSTVVLDRSRDELRRVLQRRINVFAEGHWRPEPHF